MKRGLRAELAAPAIEPASQRLSERQRAHLALISTRQRLTASTRIYEQGSPGRWVYQLREGVVCTSREMRDRTMHVTGFLFEQDLFGLTVNGRYAGHARAITDVTLLRAPVDTLKALLLRDPELEFRFICKLTHCIRRAQRHTIAIGRRSAVERVAMFISMMEQAQVHVDKDEDLVELPMSTRDIADFLQLSAATARRAFRKLEQGAIIDGDGPHRLRIRDRRAFDELLPDLGHPPPSLLEM